MSIREQFSRYLVGYEPDRSMDVDDEPVSAWVRQTMLDAIHDLDPTAALTSFANIRLTGPRFEDGVFDAEAADIFVQIDREVRAAAPTGAANAVALGFRGVRNGSVVLPLDPFPVVEGDQEAMPIGARSPGETALLRVINLHDEIEAGMQPPASLWRSTELAKRLRLLVESLDKADAGLEITLSQSDGRRRVSRLTPQGRSNARRLFERRMTTIEQGVVSGYLEAIAVTGEFAQVKLRDGKHPVDIEEVPAEVAKRLEWDSILRISVRTVTSDRFGKRPEVKHQYISRLNSEQPLPGTGE